MTRQGPDKKFIFPGLQGSEKSGLRFTVYPHGDDPVMSSLGRQQTSGAISFQGTREPNNGLNPAIVSMQYQHNLGEAAPSFQIRFKDAGRRFYDSFFMDDDWCDLTLLRHGEAYHIMRGILDGPPRLSEIIQNDGASSRTYTLSGRGFGAVWEKTPVYFNAAIGELAELNAVQALASAGAFGDGSPDTLVQAFLFHFISRLGDSTVGTQWEMPRSIPGVQSGSFFTDNVELEVLQNATLPERFAVLPGFYPDFTGNTLWDLAQQWSDPQFNELIPAMLKTGSLSRPGPDEPIEEDETTMGLIFRRRPFPYENDLDTWFTTETVTVSPQDIMSSSTLRNGGERVNNFVVKSKGFGEIVNVLQELLTSEIDREDIKRHGLRRMEVTTNYVGHGNASNTVGIIEEQRKQIRDWFALNPYFYSGVIDLARGFPDIHPGYRLRVLSPGGDNETLTFYVEGVQHRWNLKQGLKTSVLVSRGWLGTDQTLKQEVNNIRRRYTLASTQGVIRTPGITEVGGVIA